MIVCNVFPALSINVSSRFRFVGPFVCGSETSNTSGAEADVDVDAIAGGGVDEVEADGDCCCDEVCACLSDSVTLESWKKTNTCFNEGW